MKKILLGLVLAALLFPSIVFAGTINTIVKSLKDSSGTAVSSYALTSGSAIYSETLRVGDCDGYMSLLVVEDKVGGGGDVDISIEYSVDATNWYPAYTSDMAGTVTIVGNIVTALGNSSRWIVLTPRTAPYARFKFDPNANSQITVTFIYRRG